MPLEKRRGVKESQFNIVKKLLSFIYFFKKKKFLLFRFSSFPLNSPNPILPFPRISIHSPEYLFIPLSLPRWTLLPPFIPLDLDMINSRVGKNPISSPFFSFHIPSHFIFYFFLEKKKKREGGKRGFAKGLELCPCPYLSPVIPYDHPPF